MSRLSDFDVIRAVSEGEDLPRSDLRLGDLVRRKGSRHWRIVASEQQLNAFYRALGIELWSDWRWVDA